MTLYRITLTLCSPLVTPLKGDTIWGHMVWGIANHEGDEKAAEFLALEGGDTPALVVSSAFPEAALCKPIPEPEERSKTPLDADTYAKIKHRKKIKYCAASEYVEGIPETRREDDHPLTAVQILHNTIDRESNTVLAGGLYSVREMWSKIPNWDIYILSSFSAERVQELCEWAFEHGYGADASIGKGKITIKTAPQAVRAKKNGNTYMALGPFVKDSGTGITALRGDIFIRAGKLGGAFAANKSPYKKTVVLYDEGAVFTAEKPLQFAGKMLPAMHRDSRICQSAFAPVVPIS
ncbi:CRISPR-associated protein Csm4 [Treponema sp. TIM-1]|uniref:type III-A CRISPR-associated RAMP protein Csm4 n=1 Tax=Treponema sp. TIM-1 TaxID=2898417 RepID=UPI00397EBB7F